MACQRPALRCKKCLEPMPLPIVVPACTSAGLGSWPADCKPRSFLCPRCKHAFVYLVEDVNPVSFDEAALGPTHKAPNVVFLYAVRCWGTAPCQGVLQIDTFFGAEEVRDVLAQATVRGIDCGQGHILNGPIPPPMIVRAVAQLDEAWKQGEVWPSEAASDLVGTVQRHYNWPGPVSKFSAILKRRKYINTALRGPDLPNLEC